MNLSLKWFKRLDNDVNGNPRFYIPVFLLELTDKERKAKGFTKYRGKQFGPGFVIQSYNLSHDLKQLGLMK